MLSITKRLIIGAAAIVGLVGTASAAYVPGTWSDELSGTRYVAPGGSYTYTHDLTDVASGGFAPLQDFITNFSLSIDVWDDQRFDAIEIADVEVTGLTNGYVFDFGNDAFTSGWSLLGLIELNVLGSLTVTVNSVCNWLVCGDFNVGTSTLVANGYRQVPEPGTIALLGLSLLGVGLGRRKATK